MGGGVRRVITLLTDFGSSEPFVGVMKGVILGINPEAVVVDLCHRAAAYEISECDWSSDVCSSDLDTDPQLLRHG